MEDRAEDGAEAIAHRQITNLDVVVGITAGGTTPFVAGALQAARQRGAKTVFMACVPVEQVNFEADVDIRLLVGPEVVAGSTRLKAGYSNKNGFEYHFDWGNGEAGEGLRQSDG